ncbi:MAG: MerR family transcriptional regulator [Bacteroidaceae bacterium]|nr:MerR family transcriptional regulator [Bacteroidaceae bacterium]
MIGKDLKLYYSIKEAAQIVGVPESTLRYWEKQFNELQPRKTQGGARQYTKDDLELLKLISHLLKDKGLTIASAKERLKSTKQQVVDSSVIVERLKHVRDELQAMLDELK